MEIMKRMMIFLTISFSSLSIDIAASAHTPCAEERCSKDGPSISFPFRLVGKQPKHCGYNSSYNLHCDEQNRTILEMPSSSQNCSSEPESPTSSLLHRLECPNPVEYPRTDEYYAYSNAKFGVKYSGSELQSCTKMYGSKFKISAIIDEDKVNQISLSWSEPNCVECHERSEFCGWKNRSTNQYGCFGGVRIKSSHSGLLKILSTSGSIIGCFLLVPVIGAMFFLHSRMHQQKENQMKIRKFLEDYATMKPTRYSYADIKNMTNNFKHKLGEGAYGNVFKGKISNKLHVAVKLLHKSIGNGDDFINEVGTIGTIHHVNVVRLLGFCADEYNRALVFEFLPNGSLEKFIHKDGVEHHILDMGKMQNIAIGIARGIRYLHQGCQQRILHFDIKPQNILLDEKYNPKISDFGLAKLCEKGKSAVSMTAARGTMGYIAPEVFSRQFGNVSYKSDIYSFGMLLLEMIGRRKNTDLTVQNISQVYFPEWLYERLANGEELRIQIEEEGDVEITKKLAIVGLWCIQWSPFDRPSIVSVLQMLEGNGNNLNVPPNPFTSDNTENPGEQRRESSPALAMISELE